MPESTELSEMKGSLFACPSFGGDGGIDGFAVVSALLRTRTRWVIQLHRLRHKKGPQSGAFFMAVGAVGAEPFSVWISLMCREFTGKNSYIRYKFYAPVLLKPAILRHEEPNSLLFGTANFIGLSGAT